MKHTHPGCPGLAAVLSFALLAAGCAVGPNYKRPSAETPAAFKEGAGYWKPAAPSEAAPRGAWWEAFNDPLLNDMEARVASSNFSLLALANNYEEARQIARVDVAGFFPLLSAEGSVQRTFSGAGRGTATAGGLTLPSSSGAVPITTYSAQLNASWTPDFWGRQRRQAESDVAAAQASAADLALSRLSTQATLAEDYVELRISDQNKQLLENALADDRRTLQITQNKYSVGVAARSDVISAEAAVDAARASVISVGVERAQYEHAIAVLLGMAPAEFSIAPQQAFTLGVPAIPAQMPSSLLERRPDIAQAERTMAFANAKIGVAEAAYFPSIPLTGGIGYEGSPLHELFDAGNRFWSLGGSATDALLDFGARRAEVLGMRATYGADVATYRQTVLTAFQSVEDNLASLRILAEESTVQDTAVTEAAQAASIALNEYRAGTVDYTTVVTAQVTELNDRETALNILQTRLTSAVTLIQDLGGGWDASDLPSYGQVIRRHSQAPTAVAAPHS